MSRMDDSEFRVCEFCGGNHRVVFSSKYNGFLCNKHYMQYYHTGKLTLRGFKDPNEIKIYEDHAEIILYGKDKNEKARTLIDLEDVNKCKTYKWGLMSEGYVITKISKSNEYIMLHRLILNLDNKDDSHAGDHISGDKLDNRKTNLRKTTYSQNIMNSCMLSNNTSGTKGVSWDKRDKVWHSYITINRKRKNLGYYTDLNEAIRVRREAEKELFGEFNYDISRNKNNEYMEVN